MAKTALFTTASAEMTRSLGEAVGRLLFPGGYLTLSGELGAGKTTFTQGLALGMGVKDDYVTSPSFALVNEYQGRLKLYHIDLYRLTGPDDLDETGFYEYPGGGVAVVEWPERAGDTLPDSRLDVNIEYAGTDARKIAMTAFGPEYEGLMEELCRTFRW